MVAETTRAREGLRDEIEKAIDNFRDAVLATTRQERALEHARRGCIAVAHAVRSSTEGLERAQRLEAGARDVLRALVDEALRA
jgi:hypothetical protein